MKKLSIIALIVLATPGSVLLGKDLKDISLIFSSPGSIIIPLKYTKQLNNKMSETCQAVKATWLGNLERKCACGLAESYLAFNAYQPNSQLYIEDSCLQEDVLKHLVRTILPDETDDVKRQNFKELKNLAQQLQEQAKNRF
jgi:hypothetical protein